MINVCGDWQSGDCDYCDHMNFFHGEGPWEDLECDCFTNPESIQLRLMYENDYWSKRVH